MKVLRRLALVAVLLILTGQGIAWMNAAGHTWSAASVRLAQHESHQLQDFLFFLREREAPVDIVVVGDRTFLNRTIGWLPPNKAIQAVNIHRYRIDTISTLLESVPLGRVGTFIFHHSPVLWSDYQFRGRAQSIDLWRNFGEMEFNLFPYKQVAIAFQALKDFLTTSTEWQDEKHVRPRNLSSVGFDAQRQEFGRLERAIARHKNSRIIWGKDYVAYSRTSNPGLFGKMRAYSRSAEANKRFGEIISLKTLPSKF